MKLDLLKFIFTVVEQSQKLVDNLLDIFQERYWWRRFIIFELLFFILFFPYQFQISRFIASGVINWFESGQTFVKEQSAWYVPLFFITAIALLGLAFASRYRQRQNQKRLEELLKQPFGLQVRSAIRGMVSFDSSEADAVIFANLQRNSESQVIAERIARDDFKFGILSGETGVGKSSFIQAGLRPALETHKLDYIYVRLTNKSPFETLRKAVRQEHNLEASTLPTDNLSNIFRVAAKNNLSKAVIVFDQFEQFFVFRREERLEKNKTNTSDYFKEQIIEWFKQSDDSFVKLIFCVRDDYEGKVRAEFISEMSATVELLPKSFYLRRFTIEEAVGILAYMAGQAAINLQEDFDTQFIERKLTEVLAGDDGRISPIDLQIWAEMVAKQTVTENRTFTEKAFHQLGGLEGLMENFLDSGLKELNSSENSPIMQAALRLLEALIDPKQNTRAGSLKEEKIKEKIGDSIPHLDLQIVLGVLTRPEIRIIRKYATDEGDEYELVHERLIPVIRRKLGRILEPKHKLELLLSQRAEEWYDNNHANRTLLKWGELREIKQHINSFEKDSKWEIKKQLVEKSELWWGKAFLYSTIPVLLLIVCIAIPAYWYFISDAGKLYRMDNYLLDAAKKSKDPDFLTSLAVRETYRGNLEEAYELLQRIRDPIKAVNSRIKIAVLTRELGKNEEAKQLLNQAQQRIGKQYFSVNHNFYPVLLIELARHGLAGDVGKYNQETKENYDENIKYYEQELKTQELNMQFYESEKDANSKELFNAAKVNYDKAKVNYDEAKKICSMRKDLAKPFFMGNKIDLAIALKSLGDQENSIICLKQAFHEKEGTSVRDTFLYNLTDLEKQRLANVFSNNEIISTVSENFDFLLEINFLRAFAEGRELNGNLQEAEDLIELALKRSKRRKPSWLPKIKVLRAYSRIKGKKGDVEKCLNYHQQALEAYKDADVTSKPYSISELMSKKDFFRKAIINDFVLDLLEVGEVNKESALIEKAYKLFQDERYSVDNAKLVLLQIAKSAAKVAIEKNGDATLLNLSSTIVNSFESGRYSIEPLPPRYLTPLLTNLYKGKRKEEAEEVARIIALRYKDFDSLPEIDIKAINSTCIEIGDSFLLDLLIFASTTYSTESGDYYSLKFSPTYARLGNLNEAYRIANSLYYPDKKGMAFADILTQIEILKNPDFNVEKKMNEQLPDSELER